MENVFLSFGLAFIITYFSIPAIIEVTRVKKLYDVPNERKVHKKVIPTLGGLGIFAGFIISMLIGTPPGSGSVLQYFAAACLVIFFLGIKDDILILSASKKFIGQIVAAVIIIKFGGLKIDSMYGFLGIGTLPNTASFLFTALTIVVITNSFNLIDGIDGLACSLGILTSLAFGVYFIMAGEALYAVMALSLVGALSGFVIYNYNPAKIFMGDTGSLTIGLLNSILVLKFINLAGNPVSAFPIAAAPAVGFAILMVPLFDTLRVVAIRVFKRRSPFSPDRNHFHHLLLQCNLSHPKIVWVCLLANTAFMTMAWFLRPFGNTVVMGILAAVALSGVGIAYYQKPKEKRKLWKSALSLGLYNNEKDKIVPIVPPASKEKKSSILGHAVEN